MRHQWSIEIEKRAQKEFDSLNATNKAKVFEVLRTLLCSDNPLQVHGVEKFQAECGTWKIRKGDYRIMFCLESFKAQLKFAVCPMKGVLVLKHVALHHTGY